MVANSVWCGWFWWVKLGSPGLSPVSGTFSCARADDALHALELWAKHLAHKAWIEHRCSSAAAASSSNVQLEAELLFSYFFFPWNNVVCKSVDEWFNRRDWSLKGFALAGRDSDHNWPYLFQIKEKPNQLQRVSHAELQQTAWLRKQLRFIFNLISTS